MPINITQESYDKVKASPPAQRRVKRQRLEQENIGSNEEQVEDVPVTNPHPPVPEKRPRFLLSNVSNPIEVAKVNIKILVIFNII